MRNNLIKEQKNRIFRICALGMSTAFSVVLIYLIHFPIFPAVPFLEYDPGDIPILICTFLFGTVPGLLLTAVASIIQGITVSSGSGLIGILMHILATGSYVLAIGIVRHHAKFPRGFIFSCIAGTLAMTVTMIIWNLLFTPFYMHVQVSVIIGLLPFIVAFNLIKAGANSIIAIFLYGVLHKTLFKNMAED